MKTKSFSLLKYNKFFFGDQVVSQFVVFECKWLFSIIFFYFHPSEGSQDRFHTHAFNAWSIKLWGEYMEYVLTDETTGSWFSRTRFQTLRFFPRDSYHKIGNSTGCATVLFSGPWAPSWKEYKDGVVTHYSWGRENTLKQAV